MVLMASQDKALLHSLEKSLANLRQFWPVPWPGLPLVFERCWSQLGHRLDSTDPRLAALIRLGRLITQAIEDDGRRRAEQGAEPEYHNRLHIADTLVCMTHLLLALRQRRLTSVRSAHQEALMLVIMSGHDFMHPGGRNAFSGQLENLSVQALEPLISASGVSAEDQAQLVACILATDPECVKAQHQKALGQRFDLQDPVWKSVLAQESDIMASTLPQTQQALTEALSREWMPSTPKGVAQGLLQPKGRLGFLEHAALFTSPAAHLLGMNAVRSRQIKSLQKILAD